MPSRYCEPSDLFDRIPRGSLPNPARLAAHVSAATEIISLDEHGFSVDQPIIVRAEEGGVLPAPLEEGTTYYVQPLTDSTFQLAADIDGVPINLTTVGSRILFIPARPYDAAIHTGAAIINNNLPAHAVPLVAPYNVAVVNANAWLAINQLMSSAGQAPGTYDTQIKFAMQQLDTWAAGIPLRGDYVPSATNLSVTSVVSGTDPRGWIPVGGTLP